MVHGLLTPNLTSAHAAPDGTDGRTNGSTDGGTARADVSQADLPYFTQLVRSFEDTAPAETPWLEAAKLTVTATELDLIAQVSSLISSTPRAVKRFINIYLLLKSVGRGRGWPVPEHGQLALLLAIAHGLPRLADHLMPRLATAEPDQRTLRALLDGPATNEPSREHTKPSDEHTKPSDEHTKPPEEHTELSEEHAKLNDWLDAHPGWNDVPLSDAGRWIELIFRFRFGREPLTRSGGRPPLP